jgi:hypothetical protein
MVFRLKLNWIPICNLRTMKLKLVAIIFFLIFSLWFINFYVSTPWLQDMTPKFVRYIHMFDPEEKIYSLNTANCVNRSDNFNIHKEVCSILNQRRHRIESYECPYGWFSSKNCEPTFSNFSK